MVTFSHHHLWTPTTLLLVGHHLHLLHWLHLLCLLTFYICSTTSNFSMCCMWTNSTTCTLCNYTFFCTIPSLPLENWGNCCTCTTCSICCTTATHLTFSTPAFPFAFCCMTKTTVEGIEVKVLRSTVCRVGEKNSKETTGALSYQLLTYWCHGGLQVAKPSAYGQRLRECTLNRLSVHHTGTIWNLCAIRQTLWCKAASFSRWGNSTQ